MAGNNLVQKQLEKQKRARWAVVCLLTLSLILAACGEENSPVAQAPAPAPNNAGTTPTPPFPGIRQDPTVTPTRESVALVPLETPGPALFPSPTRAALPPAPTRANGEPTPTVVDPAIARLTPTAIPTGQLAYIQAGNLWLIDDTGGNRRQLTTTGDLNAAGLAWSPLRDKLVYISRNGELALVDLSGKRTVLFTPGRSAQLSPPVKLELPTTPGASPTPKPAATGLRLEKPVWSMDGRYIAFTYYQAETGALASGEVWLADVLTDKIAVSKVGNGFAPSWSGDGRSLAFVSRGEVKQGAPRPTAQPRPTGFPDTGLPQGTPLLPPSRPPLTSNANSENLSVNNQGFQTFTPTLAQTPTATGAPAQTTASGTPNPNATPTPVIVIRPGTSAATVTPFGQATATPTNTPIPTPTLDLVALPSPTATPTYPPVFLGSYLANKIQLYTTTNRTTKTLLESDKLPEAFTDVNNVLRSYVPAPLQAVWWSPDSRFIAFSDRFSVVGIITAATGAPIIWTGDPEKFAVYDLDWLPRSDGAFVRYGRSDVPQESRLSLITFNNATAAAGAVGDVTNPKLIKLSSMPATEVSCPELSPGGNYYSYFDGRLVVVVKTDGSIYNSFDDTDCPAWSPFGSGFATTRRNGDGSIAITDFNQPQVNRSLLAARAVERVYWVRSDPLILGGQPTPTPRP
jgi:hypothetical protein